MKQNIQFGAGGTSLLAGLALFIYFGTRPRPSYNGIDPEIQRQTLWHDLATFGGLGLIFLGILILFPAAVRLWSRSSENRPPQT